jgi:hypothetical protein
MSSATSNPGRTIALEALRPDATTRDQRLEAVHPNLVQSLAGSVICPEPFENGQLQLMQNWSLAR